MTEPILAFTGENRFLSNFAAVRIDFDGESYPSVEHAYQAAKTLDYSRRRRIRDAASAGEAKKLGRIVPLRPDWDRIKLDYMEDFLRQKFAQEPFRTQLLRTGDAELIEGNYWGDTFWGVYRGEGENHLGRLLMMIRTELLALCEFCKKKPRAFIGALYCGTACSQRAEAER